MEGDSIVEMQDCSRKDVQVSGRKASRHGAKLGPLTCVARKKKVLPATDEEQKGPCLTSPCRNISGDLAKRTTY